MALPTTLQERCHALWHTLRRLPSQQAQGACRVRIPPQQTDIGQALGSVFRPDEHYFRVQINELFLTYQRQWFSIYDPLLIVISEFVYGSQVIALPVVAGPLRLSRQMRKVPGGMTFLHTQSAGWYPYRGGTVTVTVLLCQVRREAHSRAVLRLIEQSADVLEGVPALPTSLHIADVVLHGVENLLQSGLLSPLLGVCSVLDPAVEGSLVPGYRVLMNLRETELGSSDFWVRDGRLMTGATLTTAHPFRQTDYVLYQLAQSNRRLDTSALPFSTLYEDVMREAARGDAASWLQARAGLLLLSSRLMQSLDLTPLQAVELQTSASAEMHLRHKKAVAAAALGRGIRHTLSRASNGSE